MDWKSFLAYILSSLAWPSAIAYVAYLFKDEVTRLIARIAHVKYGEAEVRFQEIVTTLEDEGSSCQAPKGLRKRMSNTSSSYA